MTADDIIARARKETSWTGEVSADLREGIEQTIAGFAVAPMTEEARASAMESVPADLIKRFRIEAYLAQHPEIEQQEVKGPLFVTGLARSGTTATVAMLALDPRFRFARDWELREPLPPPVWGEEDGDPRVLAARERGANMDQSIHLYDPDGPEEDMIVLAGYGMRQSHQRFPMPQSYIDWFFEADFDPFYVFHERMLKLLQSGNPAQNHWLLKSPPHLFRLDNIARQFPDATIVMTHRDPTQTVASASSLFEWMFAPICPPGAMSKESMGERSLSFWSRGMDMALRARDKIGEDRFVDVYNRDLVADPVGTFEKLYDRLGYKIDDALRARLQDYHEKNAKGAHGAHKYTAEEFGLNADKIAEAFREYKDRFGV